MELYYEQNVENHYIDQRAKRTKTLSIAKSVCFVVSLFILVSMALQIELWYMFLLFATPFAVASILLGRMNKRNNVEYDYILDDEKLVVCEIFFRQKRKKKCIIPLRTIESVGVFDSEGYKKNEHKAGKKLLALVNYDDEKSIMYILFNTDKGAKILFIEPDKGFIMTLRRALSSSALVIFDRSVPELERRLAEREAEQIATPKRALYVDRDRQEEEEDEEEAEEESETTEQEEAEGGEQEQSEDDRQEV